jgi:hypothetical protein
MIQNYNFTAENIDIINIQKSNFFSLISEQSVNLIDLEVLNYKDIDNAEKNFWTTFVENHQEIRSDIKLTRHFILKKKEKLGKELKTPLFMYNIYDNLGEDSKLEYWKFVFMAFLLFETVYNEKNDAILNTLSNELEKMVQEEILVKEKIKVKTKETTSVDQNKDTAESTNSFDMSKIGELMSGVTGSSNDSGGFDMSKLGELMGGLTGSSNNGGFDMSKLGDLMNGLNGGTENMSDIDMSKMLNSFMPGIDSKKNESLMKNLMDDITGTMGNLESTDQVFEITKQLGEKYQNMITSGQLDPTEIIGSLMGLMTDKNFNDELSKIDMSKINPEEMMAKMMEKVSPDMLNEVMGSVGGAENLDLANIGSLISGVASMSNSQNIKSEESVKLTPEQLEEMEDYYSNIKIDSQLELD